MFHIFCRPFSPNPMKCSPSFFSQEAPLEWGYVGGSGSNSDFQRAGDTDCVFQDYTLHQTHQRRRRGRGGWPHSHIHNTTGTIANLSHVISSALDLWSLFRAVFVLRATCHCLNCLSEASLEGHSGVCRRNMLLKPLTVNQPLCPASDSVSVCMSIIVFSALQCFMHDAH